MWKEEEEEDSQEKWEEDMCASSMVNGNARL